MAAKKDWIWYELMTSDPKGAAKFYSDVVGWKVEPFPGSANGTEYLVGSVGDRGVVGIMSMPPTVPPGMPPNWTGYIHTQNCDETAKAVTEAGGSVKFGPLDLPDVGRIAAVADPEGGVFNLLQPGRTDAPPRPESWVAGSVSWCELHSNDEKNLDFYVKQFGWDKVNAMDMGEHGVYQTFTSNDSRETGGSLRKGPHEKGMPTYWLYYISVDGIDAAVGRINGGGGSVLMGPHEVPGGTWVAIGKDPQGALFALHSQTR
ncbi:VOC family protein [Terriglobus aquaticus]|uniref:VOC family protein n=1 Tax=Terriglobus aquaticus TaxID=940139 RepID=A0ABW9KFJ9_9BACT|nr:VOC family protein [Terriglobus aquaticus]